MYEPDKRNVRICDVDTRELIAEIYEIVILNLGKMDKTEYNKNKENARKVGLEKGIKLEEERRIELGETKQPN